MAVSDLMVNFRCYGTSPTVVDQAEVSPDSNPSANRIAGSTDVAAVSSQEPVYDDRSLAVMIRQEA
jgi:hypothetical protein